MRDDRVVSSVSEIERGDMNTESNAIEIRLLGARDATELTRLAELDSAIAPSEPVLGGIVDGRLVAAHSLSTDESIADPFRRSDEVRSLLARRVLHLRGGGGLLGRLRRRSGTRAGSPPGPADRLYFPPQKG
jgi:hypothetical protein